jgi:acyl-CoA synthetase (AMP-forming)/AMP-acid ligase II
LLGDRIVLVAEADGRLLKTPEMAKTTIMEIRRAVAELHGVLLEVVVLVAPGSVPKTTSGKLQRYACREAYLTDLLPVIAIWRESPREGERCA